MKKSVCLFLFFAFAALALPAQDTLKRIIIDPAHPFFITGVTAIHAGNIGLPNEQPLFSVLADSVLVASVPDCRIVHDTLFFSLTGDIAGWIATNRNFKPGLKFTVRFTNTGHVDHCLENLVPLGEGGDKTYITAAGTKEWPQYLCRSRLYRPGAGPVGVVLPDNAWHLGFCDYKMDDFASVVALARRGQRDQSSTTADRWKLTLKPGGWAEYSLYFDCHPGDWHNGLRVMFRDRWLYDLPVFDNTLFDRPDLSWVRHSYLMLLQFAWDRKYYDWQKETGTFYGNWHEYDSLTGGYDIYTLWPTWPRLGLDQRNQWDMYRDLPGGLQGLHRQVESLHKEGRRYFISFNPWDEGTRKEDQLKGMADLLRATDADGVVLDTRGESSRELQDAADGVKPGIIMYSEGMAVPRDMPGIVSGRVHDALVMPPLLNLNKYIKPEFAIFRVLQLADDRLHRELAIAFFNGYGVEINTMRPGRPAWIRGEFAWMGRTTRILRENDAVFHNRQFYPLVQSMTDSVYINRWQSDDKTIYTIYSATPKGHSGPLFKIKALPADRHLVDLWNHLEVTPGVENGEAAIPVTIEPFDRAWLQTRREGSVGCIAVFPSLFQYQQKNRKLKIRVAAGDHLVISPGNPTYATGGLSFPVKQGSQVIVSKDTAWRKIVLQLFNGTELLDERVIQSETTEQAGKTADLQVFSPDGEGATGKPVLVSHPGKTTGSSRTPAGMALIPAGKFRFVTQRDPQAQEPFIPFPEYRDTTAISMPAYFMDITPVTNEQYKKFIDQSSYKPKDTTNYLKHWSNGSPVAGTEKMPVVYVSPADAKAYADYTGKRLPTEQEWQYAAQGPAAKKYPWGDLPDSTRCNFNLGHPTAVDAYPGGASPFGILDLVGNVWQLTADVYDNGSYYYNIIRGGSYYHPTASAWYITGGPVPADHPEMLLLIAPGLDRNATVGFRCVSDSKP